MDAGGPVVELRCLGCGYDLSGLGRGVCPECGLGVGPYEWAIARARATVLGRFRRGLWLRLARVASAVAVYAGAVAALANDWRAARAVAVTLCVLIAASVLVAWPIVRLARRADRKAAFVVWVRLVWLLQVPWLAMGPLVVAALAVSFIDRWLFRIGYALPVGFGIIGAVVLACLTIVCALTHADEIKRENAALGVTLGAAGWLLRGAAVVIVLVAGMVGARLGIEVLGHMAEWFGWYSMAGGGG